MMNSINNNDVIFGINGPVVTVKGSRSFSMTEMVYVGDKKLVGEVIRLSDKETTIQVYEETTGLRPGDIVTGTGAPMNVTLGPGIMDNIFDGIERPLAAIEETSGSVFIPPFRAFVEAPASSAPLLNGTVADGTATGIKNIRTVDLNGTERWYDLSGRRMVTPAKGLYIHNGKKVVVK